ncbi:MAG: L-seryl-tRNA(Sec) selenium transferase [Pseudomonadota bacterium]
MTQALANLPAVDALLCSDEGGLLIARYGRAPVTRTLQALLAEVRRQVMQDAAAVPGATDLLSEAAVMLAEADQPSLREVLNMTGTVIHTNLGRAVLPESAITSLARVAAGASNLEYDLSRGQRGDRDVHVESLLQEITGAEAATIVNNNAAAVLLTLNTLALGQGVIVSRGELVEIGGSFRMPEIMQRAGCRLVEVGATNRTHARDYEQAIDPTTALVMKVHTSNYRITGFTAMVEETELARIARSHQVPFVNDLGSGTLTDLRRFGLPHEPTVQEALAQGADLVLFSGDKLLGGPQAGLIVGRRELVDLIKSNPMKRAMRVDKLTLAAMFEVLKLYRDPESLTEHLPTLKMLARPPAEIKAVAQALLLPLGAHLQGKATAALIPVDSQIGSGALPTTTLPGFGVALTPMGRGDRPLQALVRAFRALPMPVLGRVHDGSLILDCRTLSDAGVFLDQLTNLKLS